MLVIGHRGAAGLAPENTISSLHKAVEAGVHMVEADLRQTRDGQVVLSHDPTLARTYDDRRRISDLTLEEIRAIGEKEGRRMPELTEFLEEAKLPLNLELKESGMEEKVVAAIKNFPHKVLVSSNLPLVLKKVRALDGKIPLGFIIGPKAGYVFPLMMAVAKQLDLYSIHPVSPLITPVHMKSMRRLGVKVFAWTVNDVHEFLVLKGFGVDGVFTDYPNIIK
jgi:glycerophosphoryl diester phosphodiesterase